MTTKGEKYAAAIAAQLKAERAAKGYSVEYVLEKAGMGRSAYHRYIKGERDIPMSLLVMWAEALDISLAQLVARAEERIVDEPGKSDAS